MLHADSKTDMGIQTLSQNNLAVKQLKILDYLIL